MSETKAIYVEESGVVFGPFSPDRFLHLEKTDLYKGLGQGYSIVEFLFVDGKGRFIFLEAKSSSPRPASAGAGNEDFDRFIEEVSTKFEDSFQLFLTAVLKRRASRELASGIGAFKPSSSGIKFVLVIPKHKTEWLAPLQEALERRLRKTVHLWNIKIVLMNKEIAEEYHIIR